MSCCILEVIKVLLDVLESSEVSGEYSASASEIIHLSYKLYSVEPIDIPASKRRYLTINFSKAWQ
jgi:hypothetical protein